MKKISEKANANYLNGEINIIDLVKIIWKNKLLVILITSFFSIGAVIYALSLPNIYKSKALLSPVTSETDGVSNAMRGYGNLASLAGINVPTQLSGENTAKALKKIQSLSFFTDSVLPNIYLPNLMAVKNWNQSSNTLTYDKDKYDVLTKKWTRDVEFPRSSNPSAQESYDVFKNNHLEVSEDTETGFITIGIKHQSPYIAKKWTDLIIKEINYFFRVKDKADTIATIEFLNTQISQTNYAEIKEVIAELLQQNTQQLSLIEVSDYYVFDYIDPAAVMELKHEPNRSLICIIIAFIGGFLAIIFVLIKHYFLDTKNKMKF